MYRNFAVKQIKTKTEFKKITKVLKQNKMAYYIHVKGYEAIAEREGNYYILGKRYERDIAVDIKTLISAGLSLKVQIGNYKYGPTRRYDICKELGFDVEEGS